MDATNTGAAAANINSFEPLSDFVQEGDCDTLLLYLPGFGKEQLRVQLAKTGVLKISGTRPLGDNKWSSFQKEFPVSSNCDTSKITAKFEEGILHVRQPKLIVPAQKEDKRPLAVEEPPASAKTTTNDNNREKAAAHKITPPVDRKEAKYDQKSSKPSEVTNKLDERSPATAPDKAPAGLANKADSLSKLLDAKRRQPQPSAELKVARQKMTVVLVALFAFVLGMWINNLQAWFSHPVDE